MSVLGVNPLLLGGDDGDQVLPIQRSVRLRSSASAYFSRTPASTTNRTTWTYSAWIKRGSVAAGDYVNLLTTQYNTAGTNSSIIRISGSGLEFISYDAAAITVQVLTTQVFRDPSAWYHIVVVVDTTQATASNRVKLYVNGVQVTALTTATYPSLNYNTYINTVSLVNIIGGLWFNGGGGFAISQSYDGYLTEINFIDGQALTPSSFGFINPTTGVWVPKLYTGTYGTNGFYLDFKDNSAVTTSSNVGIGKDVSGRGNYWTSNGINVSAYTGTPSNNVLYDSMIDTPTPYSDGGNNRGNYPTLQVNASQGNGAYTEANLGFKSGVTGQWRGAHASMFMPSGKFYFEATIQALSGNNFFMIGACGIQTASTLYANLTGQVANGWGVQCNGGTGGTKYNNNATLNVSNASFASWVVNDVLQCAVDVDNGRIWFGKNNVYLEGNPAAGTGASYTNLTGAIAPSVSVYGSGVDKLAVNFGQRPFSYTPPSGFVAVNTYNLPAPTIANGATQFAATTYTGTGSSLAIANTVNGKSFQPDFVWVKGRSGATDHALYDSVRGTTKQLESNTTTAETTEATGLTAFGTGGFTVGALAQMNTNTATYVGWQWKASNAAAVTNTSGSITSQVSANPSAGFSIVTYTGTGANATVGHGLGIAPKMVIIKSRTVVQDWAVYHSNLTSAAYWLQLNGTGAQNNNATIWNSTAPTSTVFSVGTAGVSNASTSPMVAYCFSEIAGYSKFGSYTGNGVVDGLFVYTGFRPRYILYKNASIASSWVIWDTTRSTYNVMGQYLIAESSIAEGTAVIIDMLSNGFKLRTADAGSNGSTNNIIFMAFAENPFNYSLAR